MLVHDNSSYPRQSDESKTHIKALLKSILTSKAHVESLKALVKSYLTTELRRATENSAVKPPFIHETSTSHYSNEVYSTQTHVELLKESRSVASNHQMRQHIGTTSVSPSREAVSVCTQTDPLGVDSGVERLKTKVENLKLQLGDLKAQLESATTSITGKNQELQQGSKVIQAQECQIRSLKIALEDAKNRNYTPTSTQTICMKESSVQVEQQQEEAANNTASAVEENKNRKHYYYDAQTVGHLLSKASQNHENLLRHAESLRLGAVDAIRNVLYLTEIAEQTMRFAPTDDVPYLAALKEAVKGSRQWETTAARQINCAKVTEDELKTDVVAYTQKVVHLLAAHRTANR